MIIEVNIISEKYGVADLQIRRFLSEDEIKAFRAPAAMAKSMAEDIAMALIRELDKRDDAEYPPGWIR